MSNLIYVDGSAFKELSLKVGALSDEVVKEADKTLGNIGTEGRKVLGKKEERVFNYGVAQSKWRARENNSEWVESRVFTKRSEKQWFVASDDSRMIGFKYENKAYQKYGNNAAQRTLRSRLNAVSKGYIYSLMANLYYKPVTYKAESPSPFFRREGESRYGRWGSKGVSYTRPARLSMDAKDIKEAMDPAMARTENDIRKIIAEWDRKK